MSLHVLTRDDLAAEMLVDDFRHVVRGISASLRRTAFLVCGDRHLPGDLGREARRALTELRSVPGRAER
ncbi:hypothetical protein ACQP2F_21845 [Actinoplanes sp. CA-030573]|uniref:hypothetical protein n=1 Tax=Actinoplanes sp. CA-030573 TaxID=3239898 RepID=UPI003D910B05